MKSTADRIKSILQEIRSFEKVQSHLSELEHRLLKAQQLKKALIELVNKEEADVDRLEKMSLKGIFHKVLGNKEEQIEKERQEYLQAFLKLEENNKEIEAILYEQKVLEKKATKNAGQKEQLASLLQTREKELTNENGPAGKRLIAIDKAKDKADVVLWEIGEAEQVGNVAIQALEQMIGYLKSARGWGNPYGNSSWQKYQRRSSIDRAREKGYHAKQLLLKFQKELGDLYSETSNYSRAIELDIYQGFLAQLFNNLISDWVLHQKIRSALSSVLNVRDKVGLDLARLGAERQRQKSNLAELENEKSQILLNL